MKKFLNIFFVTLGVIFFGIILFVAYLYFADPFGVRPLLKAISSSENINQDESTAEVNREDLGGEPLGDTSDGGFVLSDSQKKALETFGIDPASLPSSLTPTQLTCFEGILGVARVAEIRAGASPSAIEFFKAKGCL